MIRRKGCCCCCCVVVVVVAVVVDVAVGVVATDLAVAVWRCCCDD